MLTPWEERSLRLIELQTDLGDERFAEGLRTGMPQEPREYRLRRRRRAALAAPVALVGLLFASQPILLILLLLAAVAVGFAGWYVS